MIKVIIPIILLLFIIFCKKLPYIGGKINCALFAAGAAALLLAGKFNIGDWAVSWVDGLNRLSWIIALSILGSLFAEISNRLGTVDTIIGALTAKFRTHPKLLIISILATLTLAGSLLGDAIAASTVVGMITMGVLASMNLSGEIICAIIVMGASIGSIMPPITQALALSSSLVSADADAVLRIGYMTVGLTFVIVCIYCVTFLVRKHNVAGANPDVKIKYADKKAGEILRSNWKSLIPLVCLIIIVLLRTVKIPGVSVDLGPTILKAVNFIKVGDTSVNLYEFLSGVSILSGFTNGIVLSLMLASAIAFLFPAVNCDAKGVFRDSFSKVKGTVVLQICCAFMIGSFYSSGAVDAVSTFATDLNSNLLILGGTVAMILMGMLTGSQSTAQNVVFSFFGPALVASGISTTYAAVAGAHLAAAGQGMPPADLTTFVVAGLISAQFGKKVDPVKSMLYALPMCICFAAIGLIFLYI